MLCLTGKLVRLLQENYKNIVRQITTIAKYAFGFKLSPPF